MLIFPATRACETLPRRAQENGQSSRHIRARGHLEKLLAPVEKSISQALCKEHRFHQKEQTCFQSKGINSQPSAFLCSVQL